MRKTRQINIDIKNIIRSNNSFNNKLLKRLEKNIIEIQQCTISVSGLEDLSKLSIKKIQQKRHLSLRKLQKLSMQIVAYEKKITMIENQVVSKI